MYAYSARFNSDTGDFNILWNGTVIATGFDRTRAAETVIRLNANHELFNEFRMVEALRAMRGKEVHVIDVRFR